MLKFQARGKLAALLGSLLMCVGVLACGPPISDGDGLDDEFTDAVLASKEEGYTVYWLGREFTAGGVEFHGPDVGSFSGGAFDGGLEMYYPANAPSGGDRGGSMQIRLYSPDAWERTGSTLEELPRDATVRRVSIRGERGRLISLPTATRELIQLLLIVKLGDTTVVARAAAVEGQSPGAGNINPLIDEDTFLSVVENLRPYPQ